MAGYGRKIKPCFCARASGGRDAGSQTATGPAFFCARAQMRRTNRGKKKESPTRSRISELCTEGERGKEFAEKKFTAVLGDRPPPWPGGDDDDHLSSPVQPGVFW